MRSVYAISTALRSRSRLSFRLPFSLPSQLALRASCRLLRGLAALAVGVAAAGAHAQHAIGGDIRIEHAYATPTPPGSRIGAVYLTARNRGARDDRLVAAASPASGRIELHMGEIGADGVMRMRELDAVPLPANSKTDMKPGGGHHLMLIELAKPLVAGETFPMTLEFERGGKVEVQVEVHASKPGSATHKPGHGH